MMTDFQIIQNAIQNDLKRKGETYEQYLERFHFENAINETQDLVNRTTFRMIDWESINDSSMAEQWKELAARYQSDLDELQKEYDLKYKK